MFLDVMSNAHAGQSLGFCQIEEAFHFAVQPVPYLFEHDIRIGVLARMLTDSRDAGKYFIDIRQIEVAAQG